jgi:hypothetical protein
LTTDRDAALRATLAAMRRRWGPDTLRKPERGAQYAARCGVNPDDLLPVRPQPRGRVLAITHDLIAREGADLVVVGGIAGRLPKPGGGGLLPALRRVANALTRSSCSLLFLTTASPDRPAGLSALSHHVAVRLLVERLGWIHSQNDIRGYRTRVTLVNPSCVPAGRRFRLKKVSELLVDVYRDMAGGGWYVQRVYD